MPVLQLVDLAGGLGMRAATCPELVGRGLRVCGRTVVGFLLPGHGRCGMHLGERYRIRLRATLDAIRQTRTLRDLVPEPPEHGRENDEQAQADEEPNDSPGFEWPGEGWTEVATENVPFDVDRFASSALDE